MTNRARMLIDALGLADFELAEGPELESQYPAAADRIRRMRRWGRAS